MPLYSRDDNRPQTPTLTFSQPQTYTEQSQHSMKLATAERLCHQKCRSHMANCVATPSSRRSSNCSPVDDEDLSVEDILKQLKDLQKKFKEVQLDNHAVRKQLQTSNQRINIVMQNLDAEKDTNKALQSQVEALNARNLDVLEENHVLRMQLRHSSASSQESAASEAFESPLEMALLRRESEDSQREAEELEEQVYTLVEELEDRERDMEGMRREIETLRMSTGSTASSNQSEPDLHEQRCEACSPCQLRNSVEEMIASAAFESQRRRRNALVPEAPEPEMDTRLLTHYQREMRSGHLQLDQLHMYSPSVEPSMPSTPTDDVPMDLPSKPMKNSTSSSSRHAGKASKSAKSSSRAEGKQLQSAKKLPRR